MQTLILNGSPHRDGDTAYFIKLLTDHLKSEYKIINAFFDNISPCTDCRYCQKNGTCVINDEMTEIYKYTENCDNIVIASPVYFSELTGSLLNVCSRFQAFYCSRRFLGTEPVSKKKKGGIILAGGGDGSFETAEKTAKILLREMGTDVYFPAVCSHNTDKLPASEDKRAAEEILKLAEFFNKILKGPIYE